MPDTDTTETPPYEANTNIKERPLIFVDLEFTGLGAQHEILQIGAVKVAQPLFTAQGEFSVKVQPLHLEDADPKALVTIGFHEEEWHDAIPLGDALEQFDAFAHEGVLIGFNVVGDFYQLKKSYAAVGREPTYHWQVLDVQSMLFAQLYDTTLNGLRMRELVQHFGLRNGHWHDALADARATHELFLKVMDHERHV